MTPHHPTGPTLRKSFVACPLYDGNTVVEYKDDANLRIRSRCPRAMASNSTARSTTRARSCAGATRSPQVPNPSPTFGLGHALRRGLADRGRLASRLRGLPLILEFTDVRDDVIVTSVKYDNVAVVRINQRACTSPTQCTADQAGDSDVHHQLLLPGARDRARRQLPIRREVQRKRAARDAVVG